MLLQGITLSPFLCLSHFLSHKQSRHTASSFSIAFLSSLFVVCLFEPVPTSIVSQPRDLSMSFCLIHTESVCLLSFQLLSLSFLSLSHFFCIQVPPFPATATLPVHVLPFLVNDVKIDPRLNCVSAKIHLHILCV